MQIQLETCNLEYCDFLETRFLEYNHEKDFYNGTHEYKGIILYFMKDKSNDVKHVYMPLSLKSQEEIDNWKHNIQLNMDSEYKLTRINYWYLDELSCFGFGFIEIGTVTPLPQAGNPKPRLFRLIADKAIINRMGFNNKGVKSVVKQLKNRPKNLIIGANIGKNKSTPNEKASADYIACFNELFDYVDYFVINVSSPNTPNLRELQDKKPLTALIKAVQGRNKLKNKPKPLLLKIAPDLSDDQLINILNICDDTRLDGLIATNTTLSRNPLEEPPESIKKIGAGGLSGLPLADRSTEVIRFLRSKNKKIPIIGVGGIGDVSRALEKIDAGANMIQIYSGFVFKGPSLIKKINEALIKIGHNN